VKVVCSKFCDKVMGIHYSEIGFNEIENHMKTHGLCPDCGGAFGIRYSYEYICTIECSDCFSSFYPTHTKITRHVKGHKTSRLKHLTQTTFRDYIDYNVIDYRNGKRTERG
jgi:hypothetical protein